jgi:uncharacterized membrane protein
MPLTLVIIHFLAFSIGIGASVSNLIVGARAARAEPQFRPALGGVSQALGKTATHSLVLLWLSGIAMVYLDWDGWASLPPLFWAKIAAVLVLTGCSVLLNMHMLRSKRAGTPPPAPTMAMLGRVGSASALTALVIAVITFSEG